MRTAQQSVWGIDVGRAAIKALKVAPLGDGDRVEAKAADYVEYPANLARTDDDCLTVVEKALATFLGRNCWKSCKVAVAVPAHAGMVNFFRLPTPQRKHIREIIESERERSPFAVKDVSWDYQVVGGDGREDVVGLVAIRRDWIRRAIRPLVSAGVDVDLLQVDAIALSNFIAFDKLRFRAPGSFTGLLDVGTAQTVLVITDGTWVWQRTLPIGGNRFTVALAYGLKIAFAEAEQRKRNGIDLFTGEASSKRVFRQKVLRMPGDGRWEVPVGAGFPRPEASRSGRFGARKPRPYRRPASFTSRPPQLICC